jgi:hypothetical protein
MSRKQEEQACDGVSLAIQAKRVASYAATVGRHAPEVTRDAGKSKGAHSARWKNAGNIPCDRFYSKEQCSE